MALGPVLAKLGGIMTILISLITWLMIAGWILSDGQGGLGKRDPNVATAKYFNWHPLLASAAFLLFMTPAVLSYEMCPCSRKTNKVIHGSLNGFAIVSLCSALYVILDLHLNISDHGAFKSIHACCGYITFSLSVLTFLGGFIHFALGCGSDALKKKFMPYHKRLGAFSLLCGYATILLGLSEAVKEAQMQIGQLIAGFVLWTMLGVMFALIKFADKKPQQQAYIATDLDDPDDQTDDDQRV